MNPQLHETKPTLSDDRLAGLIRQIPYDIPDPGLTRRIMAQLGPPRADRLRRFFSRALRPVHITLSPLYAAAVIFAICLGGALVYRQISFPRPISSDSGHGVPVVFRLHAPHAGKVAVMGSFNNWDPSGFEMTRDADTGNWMLQVHVQPGKHDYVFLLDNKKTALDPDADLIMDDDFGSRSSVLFVKNHGDPI